MRSLDELIEEFTDKPLYKPYSSKYTPEAIEAYTKMINMLYDIGFLTEEHEAIEVIVDKLDKICDEN